MVTTTIEEKDEEKLSASEVDKMNGEDIDSNGKKIPIYKKMGAWWPIGLKITELIILLVIFIMSGWLTPHAVGKWHVCIETLYYQWFYTTSGGGFFALLALLIVIFMQEERHNIGLILLFVYFCACFGMGVWQIIDYVKTKPAKAAVWAYPSLFFVAGFIMLIDWFFELLLRYY